MIIYFDIETISQFSKDERSGTIDGKEEFTNPSKEYRENIETYVKIRNQKERYGEKYNFMPEFNKILTIAVGTMTKDGSIIKNLTGSEEEQIKAFFKAIKGNMICGFNIKGFDLPFIIKRALKYQIDIPNDIKIFGKKPREMDHIIDLQEVYKNGVFGAIGNLDLICHFLGIKSPKEDDIDGSQVQTFFDEGKVNEINEYCNRDVEATIKVYEYFKEYNLI